MKEIVSAKSSGVEELVNRDQWDRPLILPKTGHLSPCVPCTGKGGGCKCMVGYTRVSTMAETLSDSFGLNRWQKGNMLKGIARRPDLVQAARVVQSPSELYELVDLAEALGDNDVAARNGTTMHRLTERLDRGEALPEDLPDNMQAMLDAYVAEMARVRLRTVDSEVFVVQDTIECAGTFDARLVDADGNHYIGDKKTGQNLDQLALKTCMQVSIYAAGKEYDPGTGERSPNPADRDRGVLIWLPWVEDPKDAECEIRWLDLRTGRQAVKEAIAVRGLRSLKANQLLPRIR